MYVLRSPDDAWKVVKYSDSETNGVERPKFMKFMSSTLMQEKILMVGGLECSGEPLSEVWTYSFGSMA